MAELTDDAFFAKWVPLLADNDFQNIDGPRLALLLADMRDSLPWRRSLNVRQVKGATYPVPYTDSLGTIPDDYLVLGMQAIARNGQTQAQAASSFTPAAPVTFQLLANAGGPVPALLDEQPGTVATTPAVWVQVSGSQVQIVDSFPALVIQNLDGSAHPYNAGDKFKYVFTSGTARLFEVRAYLSMASNPVPTGDESDPYYRPFAPLITGGGGGAGTVQTVNGVAPNPAGNVTLPQRDIYGYSQNKRTQVFTVLFTDPAQIKAVDVALPGDVSTGIGSRIPDLGNGDLYELVADPDNPLLDTGGNPVLNAQGQQLGTPTWLRY